MLDKNTKDRIAIDARKYWMNTKGDQGELDYAAGATAEAERCSRQWISVKEGMPENDNEVLVFLNDDEMIVQAYYNQRNQIWYGSASVRSQMREGDCEDAELEKEKITHWRPLPDPPYQLQ